MTRLLIVMILACAAPVWALDGGKAVFEAKCASCHGKDAKGNPAMAKMFKVEKSALDLTSEEFQSDTDEDVLKIINDGKGKMPAYKAKLKADEISSVLGYLRSLAPAKKEKVEAKEAKPDAEKK